LVVIDSLKLSKF